MNIRATRFGVRWGPLIERPNADVELIKDRSVCGVAVVVGREEPITEEMLDAPAWGHWPPLTSVDDPPKGGSSTRPSRLCGGDRAHQLEGFELG